MYSVFHFIKSLWLEYWILCISDIEMRLSLILRKKLKATISVIFRKQQRLLNVNFTYEGVWKISWLMEQVIAYEALQSSLYLPGSM